MFLDIEQARLDALEEGWPEENPFEFILDSVVV